MDIVAGGRFFVGGTTEYDANINNKDYWRAIVTYNVEESGFAMQSLGVSLS